MTELRSAMSLERGQLLGLAPLEEGLSFAARCMVEIIDQIEEAYEAGDDKKMRDLYVLFERYTGRMSIINDQIERLLRANLAIVERRWSIGEDDVS